MNIEPARRTRPGEPRPAWRTMAEAVGHEGSSSAPQCCSLIRLVAFPEEGVVVSVQASTPATDDVYGTYNSDVVRLTQALRDAALG